MQCMQICFEEGEWANNKGSMALSELLRFEFTHGFQDNKSMPDPRIWNYYLI